MRGGPHLRVAQKPAILLAVAAAALYGLSAPVSKLLLGSVGATMLPRCCIWARARGCWPCGSRSARWAPRRAKRP